MRDRWQVDVWFRMPWEDDVIVDIRRFKFWITARYFAWENTRWHSWRSTYTEMTRLPKALEHGGLEVPGDGH